MVPANVYFQSVSGTGNTRTALIMEMSVLVVYVAYITYLILYLRVDIALCWTSEHVYAILTLYSAEGISKKEIGNRKRYNQ